MTDEANTPPQTASPSEAQASLRAELAQKIGDAQSEIESTLRELRAATVKDTSADASLASQLAMLTVLRQSVDAASPTALAQLRQAVAMAVASSAAAVEQARPNADAVQTAQAAYQAATAELDRKVAATVAIDQANDDEAHKLAARYGIDLTDEDDERKRLRAERDAAVARGDMLTARRIDVQISQNTADTMAEVAPHVTDPADKAALTTAIASENDVLAVRTSALTDQQALEANRPTVASPETVQAVAPAAPAPDAGFAAFASGLSLNGASQIALSDAPDAHTTVEVPNVARHGAGPSLGGIGSP